MRFSTTFIAAAGLSASVFAAPIGEDSFDCDDDFTSSTAIVLPSISAALPVVSSAQSLPSSIIASSSVAEIAVKTSAISSLLPPTASVSNIVIKSTATVIPVASSAQATSTAAGVVATSASSPAATDAASSNSSGSGLQFFGVNESGAEFGNTNIPGVLGTDYTWPNTSAIQILMDKGMNTFRIAFLMERLAQGTMTAALDATYLADMKTVVNYITTAGGNAILDPHNFGRYDGTIFTSTSDFKTFWTNVATEFATNEKVIFDCNNEFHDMPTATIVAELNQACIDGVRAAGATSQYVFVEGTSYTGAWTWTTSGNSENMGNLTDPSDKIVYEMHQYLDSDGSGTSATCVSTTIGAERIAAATTWLRENGKKGIIGEFAGGANADCETAVTGMLDALVAGSDVWTGALWWGGGPWWGDYIFSMEPEAGTAYVAYIDTLSKYATA